MELKELEAAYGRLMIQFEILQAKIMEVKKQIADKMNEVKPKIEIKKKED